jgi:hypothetical protein
MGKSPQAFEIAQNGDGEAIITMAKPHESCYESSDLIVTTRMRKAGASILEDADGSMEERAEAVYTAMVLESMKPVSDGQRRLEIFQAKSRR